MDSYLNLIAGISEGRGLERGFVSQTTFWMLSDDGEVVGMSRLRHSLTPSLTEKGGLIGYYVRKTGSTEDTGFKALISGKLIPESGDGCLFLS